MSAAMLSSEAVTWACTRIEEFYAVNRNGNLLEALRTLREGFGLTDENLEGFTEWVERFVGEEYDEPMLLGLLIGVMAADHERW